MDNRSHTNKSSGIKRSSNRSSGDPYHDYRSATSSSRHSSNAWREVVHQEHARGYNPAGLHSAYDRGKRWRGGGGGGGGSGTGYSRGSLDLEAREHHHARENAKKGLDEATSDKESYESVESSIKNQISLPDSNSEEDSHTDVGSFEVSNTAGNETRNPRPQATASALSNDDTSCPNASRPADLPGRPAHSTSPPGRSDDEDPKFHPGKLESTFDSQKAYLSEAPVDIFPDNIPRNRELSNAGSHLPEASSPNDTRSRSGQKPEIATCTNCFTQSTPLWRYDTERQLLCNACGLFSKLHGRARPLSLKTELIKKRDRESQANLPIGKIVTSPYDRMTTRSMRMTPKEPEHALRGPSDEPRLPASTDTNAEPQSSRTQLCKPGNPLNKQALQNLQERTYKFAVSDDVKIEESAEAEKIEDPTRLRITVDKPFMRYSQPLRLLPERSERIQLTIRRLTESIYSHCQAHNGRFREHTASSSHTSSSSSTSSRSEQETTQAAPSSSQSQRPMKRRKISQNPDGEESDEEGKTSNTSKGKEKESPPRFACLYFKHDRSQYGDRRQWRECSGPGWPDMHRLKEHLFRRHMKAKHCCRCWKTFKDASALVKHQRSKLQCDVLPEKTIDGLTELQATQLRARKTFSKMEEFAKWRKAYMIIFPDVTENQIPEPYYIPEDFYDFSFVDTSEKPKAYLRRELPARISNKLMAQLKRENIGHGDLKELCEKAVYEALDDLSRSTHEHIGTQYESKIPIAHINSETPITAISQPHEWSQEPVVSSTFTWDVADPEADFDPSFLDQSMDQFVGDPGLDFLSENPGLPQGHPALSSLEGDVDCVQFSWATKEISDSGYNSLLGGGSHTSSLPQ